MNDDIKIYFDEIKELDSNDISLEESLGKIILSYKEGKCRHEEFISARNRLVELNLKLVVKIALSYKNLRLQDAIQDGNMGLIEAVKHFDYRKGRFSTIAYQYIKFAILEGSNRNEFIYLPAKIRTDINRLNKEASKYYKNHNTIATDSYLSNALKVKETYIRFLNILPSVLSTDDVYDLEDRNEDWGSISDAFIELTDKEKEVINLYYGFTKGPYNFKEIGAIMSLSKERIRQIHECAIKKIKDGAFL